jgi:hypothetical protein
MKFKAILCASVFALLSTALAARSSEPAVLYILGGAGLQLLGDNDASDYFSSNGVDQTSGFATYSGHLGFQFERMMTLELSAEAGPTRNYDIQYSGGAFTNRQVKANWNVATFSIMPAITWTGSNEVATNVSLIGVRVGYAILNGQVTDSVNGNIGNYDQDAHTVDVGVLLRTQFIFFNHVSAGVEGGYNWTRFDSVQNRNRSGVANTPAGSSLDFSGPRIAFVLGLWSGNPGRATVLEGPSED